MSFFLADNRTAFNGLTWTTSNGESSGCSGSRVTNGLVQCGSSNSITSVSESPLCTYNFVVTTPALCISSSSTAVYVPPSIQPAYCGVDQFNLTGIPVLQANGPSYSTIFIGLCSTVPLNCYGQNDYICQHDATGFTALARNLTFGYANGVNAVAGLIFTDTSGALCNNGTRYVYGTITCGVNTTVLAYSVQGCTHYILITSPLVCIVGSSSTGVATSALSHPSYCGIDQFDFSSIPELQVGGPSLPSTYLSLCHATYHCYGNNEYACYHDGSSYYAIARNITFSYLNRGNAANGISFYSQSGDMCNGAPRILTGTIVCDPNNTMITSYSITSSCTHNVILTSPLVCLSSPPPITCGLPDINLSPLASNNPLTVRDVNNNNYYLQMCNYMSISTGSICNGMMCQTYSNTKHILSYNAALDFTYIDSNDHSRGMFLQTYNGDTAQCMINGNLVTARYQTTITITCGLADVLIYDGLAANNSCEYVFQLQTTLACGPYSYNKNNGVNDGGGDSLSDGAIAGIVIGSVVGLLCCCALLALAFSTALKTPQNSTQHPQHYPPKTTQLAEPTVMYDPVTTAQTSYV